MNEGYTWLDHLDAAIMHLSQAKAAMDDVETVLEELTASRASATRAIVMLPKPVYDDAA